MSNQTIGNNGIVPQEPQVLQLPSAYTRSFTGTPQIGDGFSQYPGLGGNIFLPQSGGFPPTGGNPTNFLGGGNTSTGGGGNFLSKLLGGGGGGSSASSGLNLQQISGFVERMGGIEGIIGTMGKVQKFVNSFQQMAPMMKVLFNSFTKGKAKPSYDADEIPRRRKSRKKSSSSRKRKKSKSTSGKRKR